MDGEGMGIHMGESVQDVPNEVAQEAQGMRTYQRRRSREERDADVPGVDPLAPYIYPPFVGIYPNPLELVPLPYAAYFIPTTCVRVGHHCLRPGC